MLFKKSKKHSFLHCFVNSALQKIFNFKKKSTFCLYFVCSKTICLYLCTQKSGHGDLIQQTTSKKQSKMENLKQAESQFLDFKTNKVQIITMEQLRDTYKENNAKGEPEFGIYHFDLFDKVMGIGKEFGYDMEFYDLFAAQNKDGHTPGVTLSPQFEEIYGERSVKAHTLRRVFANVRIKDFDTDEYTTNLSIAFHQRGIQAGFGNNVKICHNQCFLGRASEGTRYAATYSERGTQKYEIPQMLDLIRSWFMDARHIVETDRKRIERMKEIPVDDKQMAFLIGLLTTTRVKRDSKHFKDVNEYPLSQTQINDYTEDLLIRRESNPLTVWDMYDAATNLYKVQSMDMANILPMNMRMAGFLAEQYDF